jgi:hypothetical protein
MKKILFISIIAASTGLLGNDLPTNQPSSQQDHRSTSVVRVERHRVRAVRHISHTPENDSTVRSMQRAFNRNMNRAIQGMPASRPAPVVIPQNNFATDPSDNR